MIDNLRRSLSAPATFATLARRLVPAGSRRRAAGRLFVLGDPLPSRAPLLLLERSSEAARASPSGASCAASPRISRSASRRRRCGSSFSRTRPGCGPTRSRARSGGSRSRGATCSNGCRPRRRTARSIWKSPASIGACAAAIAAGRGRGPARRGLRARRAGAWAAPFVAALARSRRGRAVGQPASARTAGTPALAGAGAAVPPDRAADLAVLRAFRRPETHDLPADNFQEVPQPEVARRTSPTNIGLSLLSTVAANDFGWIGTVDMVRAPRGGSRHDRAPRALPRPPLQLVRHGRPRAARAPVRLHGRQRQPRRAPDHASSTPASSGWTSRSRSGGRRRHRRHARAAARVRDGAGGRAVGAASSPPAARGRPATRRARCSRPCPPTPPSGRSVWRPCPRAPRRSSTSCARSSRKATASANRARRSSGRWRLRLRREPCARLRSHAGTARAGRGLRTAVSPRSPHGAEPHRGGDGLHVSLRSTPRALFDRVPPVGRDARPRPLRPARLGGAAGELHRDRARRRARGALVPPRPPADSRRPGVRADVLVRLHVRVPDARPRARGAVGQPARAHQPARRAAADPVRRGARRALGNLRVGLQRAGRPLHVPVLELRRQRPRLEARPLGGSRRRAVRHGAGRHGRAGRRAPRTSSGSRRSARSGHTASTSRSTTRRRGCPRERRSRS